MYEQRIIELKYCPTNTYLIFGSKGILLFDTGWAGTFPSFCREMGSHGIPVQDISYILISHFHPDHCGIVQQIADCGPTAAVIDLQLGYLHSADVIFRKEKQNDFSPVNDRNIRVIKNGDTRDFLSEIGIGGEILPTPGHSDDSISLCLDDGSFFVGDLNPLYELELHKGTQIAESWERLLKKAPKTIYYGHARTVRIDPESLRSACFACGCFETGPELGIVSKPSGNADNIVTGFKEKLSLKPSGNADNIVTGFKEKLSSKLAGNDKYIRHNTQDEVHVRKAGSSEATDFAETAALIRQIIKYTDKGYSAERIRKKTGASVDWIEDVMRMYLTHPGVSLQGILDRMEIRGR